MKIKFIRNQNIFRKFYDFVRMLFLDFLDRKNRKKNPFGMFAFVGLPGAGKTLSMVHALEEAHIFYPQAKIYTNFGYKHQHGELIHWKQLVTIEHPGGVIFAIDEAHDVFDRKNWGNMPPSVLSVFSQQRKYGKMFLCTMQSFEDIVVDIRRRTTYVVECSNLFNRWIFNVGFHGLNYRPKTEDISPTFRRKRAFHYNFIAKSKHYNAYDTLAFIKMQGFDNPKNSDVSSS